MQSQPANVNDRPLRHCVHDDIILQQPVAQDEERKVPKPAEESLSVATVTVPAEGYHTRSGRVKKKTDC